MQSDYDPCLIGIIEIAVRAGEQGPGAILARIGMTVWCGRTGAGGRIGWAVGPHHRSGPDPGCSGPPARGQRRRQGPPPRPRSTAGATPAPPAYSLDFSTGASLHPSIALGPKHHVAHFILLPPAHCRPQNDHLPAVAMSNQCHAARLCVVWNRVEYWTCTFLSPERPSVRYGRQHSISDIWTSEGRGWRMWLNVRHDVTASNQWHIKSIMECACYPALTNLIGFLA